MVGEVKKRKIGNAKEFTYSQEKIKYDNKGTKAFTYVHLFPYGIGT
jgi:hypothetical protein